MHSGTQAVDHDTDEPAASPSIDEADNSPDVPSSAADSRTSWTWQTWLYVAAAGVGLFAATALAAYTGGTGLALVFLGVLSVAVALSVVRETSAHTAVLAGFTVVLGWMFCLTTIGIPTLTSLPFAKSWFFTSEPMDFVARDYHFTGSLELRRWVVVAALLAPTAGAAIWMAVARTRRQRQLETRGLLPMIGVALLACIPLIAAAWLKSTDTYKLLAPTMSGDGRNFLLHTQRIRVDSQYENLVGTLGQGDFGPSLSALISKASGANGLFQITDQYSIVGTYLLAASVIVASMMHVGVQMATRVLSPERRSRSLAVALAVVSAVLGALLASNQWTMNETFRSGFFSLYMAFAFTALWVALQLGMNLKDVRWWIGIGIVLMLLFCSYQPAAALPGLVSGGYAVVTIWPFVRASWRVVVPVLVILALLVWWSGLVSEFVDRAESRVMLPGAIIDTSDWFLVVLIPFGVGLVLLGSGVLRRIALILVTIPPGTWFLLWFFTHAREARGETSPGYYGAKFLYIALFLAITCVLAVFLYAVALAGGRRTGDRATQLVRRLDSLRASVGVILIGVGATMVVTQVGPTSTILTNARTGWNQPTPQIAREVFGHWTSQGAIFLQFSDPGNDRIANFWGPLFWSGDRWNWAYGDPVYEPEAICALMAPGPVTLITSSPDYANSIKAACPDVFDTIQVFS